VIVGGRILKQAAAAFFATALLAACATTAPPLPAGEPDGPAAPPVIVDPPHVEIPAVTGPGPQSLSGWDQEYHLVAFEAWVAGCGAARDAAGMAVCARARTLADTRPSPTDARAFFETNFTVVQATTADGAPGLLTSYFAPEYAARHVQDAEFDAPVLATPADLVRGRPYAERSVIEAQIPAAPLAWMRAEDLFFMQIQGSGYLTFEDGTQARAAYAADNGQRFRGIATPMADRGLLPPNGTSGDAIRAWLAAHRGSEARAVMALNPRYIFFRIDPDDGGHPAGAAGIPLPPRRSIAIDPASWTYGDLVWLEADAGNLTGARAGYRGLVMALDTGSAIRGPVRADLYMGRGDAAGAEAGSVRHPLRMWRLVPKG
jgi:membrane-bound lytic murein transglycosylase A